MKKIIILLLAVLFILTGCNAKPTTETKTEEAKKIVIGASLLTQAHPFQVAIQESIVAEAEKNNATVSVSIADQDLNRQISAIEDFITQKVDVIIVVPVDSDGITGAIKKAKDANIPVITVDIKANGVDVDSHIATDNYSGGMIASEIMAKYLEGESEIGLITYPEVQSVRDRIDGFKENAKNHPNLKIVSELPGRDRQAAKTASEDMLTANPNLKGIFGFGDDMAISATAAIAERNSSAIVIGFDGLEEAQKSVSSDNAFKAVVVQFPNEMGKKSVEVALDILAGKTVEKEIPITPGLFVEGKGFVDVKVENNKVIISE